MSKRQQPRKGKPPTKGSGQQKGGGKRQPGRGRGGGGGGGGQPGRQPKKVAPPFLQSKGRVNLKGLSFVQDADGACDAAPTTLEELAARAQQATADYELEQELAGSDGEGANRGSDEVSDSSRRAFYKDFKRVVDVADVILEVLDARDPLGCRCRRIEQQILAAGSDKRLVLVLNKVDLVPKAVVVKWTRYLKNEFPTIAFKASTQHQATRLKQSKAAAVGGRDSASSACYGAPELMSLLGNYCHNLGLKTAIRVGIVGYPNVGKSSIINSLKRGKVCGVGAMPGFTTSCQEIVLDKHIKLIDSPGIVFAETGSASDFVLRNCIKIEDLADPITPVETIVARCDHARLLALYDIPEFETADQFLRALCKRLGKLSKGGLPDLEGAARSVLQDWNCGKISYYTDPPETHTMPTHVAANFCEKWGSEFSIRGLTAVDGADDDEAASNDECADPNAEPPPPAVVPAEQPEAKPPR